MSCVTSLVTPWAQKKYRKLFSSWIIIGSCRIRLWHRQISSCALSQWRYVPSFVVWLNNPWCYIRPWRHSCCWVLRSMIYDQPNLKSLMNVILRRSFLCFFFLWILFSMEPLGCGQRPFLWLVQLQFLSDPWWWSSAEISNWRLWHLHIVATEYPFLTFVCFLNRHSNNLVCIYMCDVYVNIKTFGLQFFPEETITIPLRMLYASINTAQTPHIGAI